MYNVWFMWMYIAIGIGFAAGQGDLGWEIVRNMIFWPLGLGFFIGTSIPS